MRALKYDVFIKTYRRAPLERIYARCDARPLSPRYELQRRRRLLMHSSAAAARLIGFNVFLNDHESSFLPERETAISLPRQRPLRPRRHFLSSAARSDGVEVLRLGVVFGGSWKLKNFEKCKSRVIHKHWILFPPIDV